MPKLILFDGTMPHRRWYDEKSMDAMERFWSSGLSDGSIYGLQSYANDPDGISHELVRRWDEGEAGERWFYRRRWDEHGHAWPMAAEPRGGLFDVDQWQEFLDRLFHESTHFSRATKTLLYVEPHGASEFKVRMKREGPWRDNGGFGPGDATRMIACLQESRKGAWHPIPDALCPGGSSSERHFAWAHMAGFDNLPMAINYKTYKLTTIKGTDKNTRIVMNPQYGIEPRLPVWASNISGSALQGIDVQTFVDGILKPLQNGEWPKRDFIGEHNDASRIVLPEPEYVMVYANHLVRGEKFDELREALEAAA